MSASNFARKQFDRFEIGGFINAKFVPEDRLQTKMSANHEEDSVSNKSHSAHNWHLRGALMQAINVRWYQAVCRETLLVTDCCSPKLRRLHKPPDFRPRIPNVTLDYHVIAIQCSAQIIFLCRFYRKKITTDEILKFQELADALQLQGV